MEVSTEYVIYQTRSIMGSDSLALEKVVNYRTFETEEQAIQYLIDEKMTYDEYLILKRVYIRDY